MHLPGANNCELPDAFSRSGGLQVWRTAPGEQKYIPPLSGRVSFPPYVYAFFFPYVCGSSLAQEMCGAGALMAARAAGGADYW